MDAVIAGIGSQAQIGDDEPLGRQRAGLVVASRTRSFGRGRHHIDAGLQVPERLVDGERGRHIGVQRGSRRDLARPDLDPAFVAEVRQLIAAERLLEVAVDHGVDEIAVADPEHLHRHGLRVHADQRNAPLPGARQHVSAAGEADERLAVPHIDVEFSGFGQAFLDGRRQASAQIDVVTLAVLETLDAELLVFRRQRRTVGAGKRHERRKVGPLGKVLRELEADPRRGRVRIHGVIKQPEAVVVAHLFVLLANVSHLAQIERQPQRVERRTPQLAFRESATENGQRVGLGARIMRPLIGDIGGGGSPLQQEGLLLTRGRFDLENRPRQA